MAYSVVQSKSGFAATGSTLAATYGTALGSGGKLTVLVSVAGTTTSTVKDAALNSFTKIASKTSASNSCDLSLWAIDTPAGDVGGTPAITATFAGASNGCAILVQEVSGLLAGNTTAMADGTAGTETAAVGANTTSPVYSSTATAEYLVACYGDDGLTQAITWTKPAGYTADPNAVNAQGDSNVAISWKDSTNGAESGNYTQSVTSDDKNQILVAFKLAGAAAASTPGTAARIPPGRQSPAAWSRLRVPPQSPAPPAVPPPATGAATPHPLPPGRQSPMAWGRLVAPQPGQPATPPPPVPAADTSVPGQAKPGRFTPGASSPALPPAGPVAPYGTPRPPAPGRQSPAAWGRLLVPRASAPAAAVTPAAPAPRGFPVQARQVPAPRGRVTSRNGTYGQPGPPVRALASAVAGRLRGLPSRGRTTTRAGVYGQQGPPVRAASGPVQARQLPQRGGSTSSRRGVYGQLGPPVKPAPGPVRARPPLPLGGRAVGRAGTFTLVILGQGPPVYPWHGPVRARPGPQRGGSTAARYGTYGRTGAPVKPAAGPVRAQPGPQRGGGRAASRYGTYTSVVLGSGPPVYPLGHPVQARRQPARGGSVSHRAGPYAGTGPAPIPLHHPVGVYRQQPPPPVQGRVAKAAGVRGQAGPPVIPLRHPVRGQPQRPLLTGRAAWRAGTYTAPLVAPFTVGALTAADKRGSALTAASAGNALTASAAATGAITAGTQRTGGPS